jgi:hypothetical protein
MCQYPQYGRKFDDHYSFVFRLNVKGLAPLHLVAAKAIHIETKPLPNNRSHRPRSLIPALISNKRPPTPAINKGGQETESGRLR